MNKENYSEKLRDPRWQKKRLKIFERDNFQCRNCRSDVDTLNIHHLFYLKNKNPWEYPDEILITLCEDCHEGFTFEGPGEMMSFLKFLFETDLSIMDLFDVGVIISKSDFYIKKKYRLKWKDLLMSLEQLIEAEEIIKWLVNESRRKRRRLNKIKKEMAAKENNLQKNG